MTTYSLLFNTIIEKAGLGVPLDKIKLIRHALSNKEVSALYKQGFLQAYQAEQAKPIFDGFEYLLSFLGGRGGRSRFIGCYKIGNMHEEDEKPTFMPKDYLFPEHFQRGVFYDLIEQPEILTDLRNRLVVEWPKPNQQNWHLSANEYNLPILAINSMYRFPGYEKICLQFDVLKQIIESNDDEWYLPLSSIYAIYLICTPYGQYVGSATGQDGLWGRWADYVKNKHGGDKEMKCINDEHPDAYRQYQFSILQILPKTLPSSEVIETWENLFKVKLKTRTCDTPKGLNQNWGKDESFLHFTDWS